MQTHLYFIRHAHSVYSTDERNRPLSERGFQDAQKVAEALREEKIDHVLSSPYKRAIQTVEVLAEELGQEIKAYEDFKERLLSKVAVADFQAAIDRVWEGEQFAFPGGESNQDAQKRGVAQLTEVLKLYEGKRIAIGMHGNLMVLIMNYFDASYHVDFWRKLQMPDIYCLSFEGTGFVAVKKHIKGGNRVIKAVVFDLDGTLLDRDASLNAFIDSQYDRLKGALKHIPRKQFCDRFIELDAKGYVWKDQVYAQLAKEYAIQGISPEKLLRDYLENFAIHCQPFPHLLEMLETLKGNSLRLGMITNGRGQFQMDNIQALKIAPYFDVILISEWEGLRKPDPIIFQKALQKLGVWAEEAVYIGDHPKNDIQAAKTAGILGIWKRDPFWEPEPSGLTIESLSEIPDLIDKMNLLVRPYRPEDLEVLVDLFYETVHTVNAAQYTPEQLNAWAPLEEKEERIEKWQDSIGRNVSFVAEQAGKIVGFSDLQKDGYLNRLYVHKDHQRQGIAAALLKAVEKEAEKLALAEITVDASLTAKPFFEKHGYETIRQQTVVRKGVTLINFKMVKTMY